MRSRERSAITHSQQLHPKKFLTGYGSRDRGGINMINNGFVRSLESMRLAARKKLYFVAVWIVSSCLMLSLMSKHSKAR
jgi:hypothetical protein